jgi:two-component system sensor histidine kinase BaeS
VAVAVDDHWDAADQPGGGAAPGAAAVVPLAPAAIDTSPAQPVPVLPARATTTQPRRSRPVGTASPVAEALGTIAHELRTPLATLQVSLEILTEFASLRPEEVQELVQRLQSGVTWLDRLIENLDTWAAVETEHLTLRRATVPVVAWLEPALTLVQPLLDRRDQQIELVCPSPAPIVDGDVTRLGQVVVNLLVNASKYSVWGDRLIVTVAADDTDVRVAVIDHGDGVLPEEQRRIFKRRARGLAALSSGERGHGIGLHVVKGIVEAHGGTVGVESAYGKGATFWFTLPRHLG